MEGNREIGVVLFLTCEYAKRSEMGYRNGQQFHLLTHSLHPSLRCTCKLPVVNNFADQCIRLR